MNQNDIIQNLLNKVTQEIYATVQLTAIIKEKELRIDGLEKEIEEIKKDNKSVYEEDEKEGD